MTHTLVPWRIGKSNQGKIPLATQPPAIKAGDEFIALLGGGSIHFANAEANAEFIVCACNSHDALLEACQTILAHCKEQCEAMGSEDIIEGDFARVLEAAIAKAKPKQSMRKG